MPFFSVSSPHPDAGVQLLKIHPKLGTPELPWPERKSAQAAGYDLAAAIDEPMHLTPGTRAIIPLGFAMALPADFEAQIRPRSGLASKFWLTMPNSPGTVDADYRGEVKVILRNDAPSGMGNEATFTILPGMRIAQMVIARLPTVALNEVSSFQDFETQRGAGGFGSTGA